MNSTSRMRCDSSLYFLFLWEMTETTEIRHTKRAPCPYKRVIICRLLKSRQISLRKNVLRVESVFEWFSRWVIFLSLQLLGIIVAIFFVNDLFVISPAHHTNDSTSYLEDHSSPTDRVVLLPNGLF